MRSVRHPGSYERVFSLFGADIYFGGVPVAEGLTPGFGRGQVSRPAGLIGTHNNEEGEGCLNPLCAPLRRGGIARRVRFLKGVLAQYGTKSASPWRGRKFLKKFVALYGSFDKFAHSQNGRECAFACWMSLKAGVCS